MSEVFIQKWHSHLNWCRYGNSTGSRRRWLLLVFKSPVLWTGKKPDLDWTEPKKTGLSVAVCHSFKGNWLRLHDLWGKKKPVWTGPNRFYYVYISSYNNRINIYPQLHLLTTFMPCHLPSHHPCHAASQDNITTTTHFTTLHIHHYDHNNGQVVMKNDGRLGLCYVMTNDYHNE